MNPITCVGDLLSAPLLCCPVCFRRLELAGAVDVNVAIGKLARILTEPFFEAISGRDLATLVSWNAISRRVVDLTAEE